MNTLTVKDLRKTYANGVVAMDGISLELQSGLFGLLGPNGAGKSSFMRTLAGLQLPDSGTVSFNGVDALKNPLLLKKQLGYLPQDFGVYPGLSACMLLDHLALLKGVGPARERKEQILTLLEKTNLYAHRNKAVSGFSGGMRQRFGIAQALLGDPRLLIVDEPTAGLDPEERNRFNALLSELAEDRVLLLSTHLVEDVHNLCPRMGILHRGRLIALGKPTDFIASLEGRVWTGSADLLKPQTELQVISRCYLGGRPQVNVYAEQCPGDRFQAKRPGLEDVYFTQLLSAS